MKTSNCLVRLIFLYKILIKEKYCKQRKAIDFIICHLFATRLYLIYLLDSTQSVLSTYFLHLY